MKGIILYRILTLIVNVFCTMIGMVLVLELAMVFANPTLALNFFISLSIVLYAWHANRFLLKVLIKNETTTKKHKDWLQVNAIVTLIASLLTIVASAALFAIPKLHESVIKQLPAEFQSSFNKAVIIGMIISACLVLHVIWTYTLIRKYKASFIEE